jgi:hypothetical protein
MMAKKIVSIFWLVVIVTLTGGSLFCQPVEPTVKYYIEAQLFPENSSLRGSESLTWRNPAEVPAQTLRFHLYYNAFKNEKTTFFREAKFYRKPKEKLKEYRFGEIKIEEMRIIGGEELTEKIRYIAPDDGNEDDQTVMEVALAEPVAPGQAITLKIDFNLTIPQIFIRSGQADDYFFMGQWFPKIGVLQADGQWNCHQYHRHSEFFADFGEYRVALTVPEKFIIGATGNLESKKKNADGSYTYIFEEKNIHDFAWAASPHFNKIVEQIQLTGNSHETNIILLLSPHHRKAQHRYLNTLKFAMRFCAEHLFAYPYKNITLVDPPLKGAASGGMEYPTLITGHYIPYLPASLKLTEIITIHEFAHQYWYGMIGSDEAGEAWLDEGVTVFFEMEIADAYFQNAASFLDLSWLPIYSWEIKRFRLASLLPVDKPNQHAWDFLDGRHYSANVYDKAGLFLRTLKNLVGREKMYGFFKLYAERFKLKHPGGDDFIDTFNEYMDEDFSWAFDQFIKGETLLDQSVYAVESVKIEENPERYRNEAIFLRSQGYFPVDILIKLKNGEEIKYFWKEKEKKRKIVFQHQSPIDYAVIDPKFKVLLDINLINNSKTLTFEAKGSNRWWARLGFYFQNILSFIFL